MPSEPNANQCNLTPQILHGTLIQRLFFDSNVRITETNESIREQAVNQRENQGGSSMIA